MDGEVLLDSTPIEVGEQVSQEHLLLSGPLREAPRRGAGNAAPSSVGLAEEQEAGSPAWVLTAPDAASEQSRGVASHADFRSSSEQG